MAQSRLLSVTCGRAARRCARDPAERSEVVLHGGHGANARSQVIEVILATLGWVIAFRALNRYPGRTPRVPT